MAEIEEDLRHLDQKQDKISGQFSEANAAKETSRRQVEDWNRSLDGGDGPFSTSVQSGQELETHPRTKGCTPNQEEGADWICGRNS